MEAFAQKGNKGFFEASERLYAEKPVITDERLVELGKELKLNAFRIKRAINKRIHDTKIDTDMDLATDFKARGVPHFFINGRRLSGAQPIDKFRKIIDEEIPKAKALLAKGTPAFKLYSTLIKDGKSPPPPAVKRIGAPPRTSPSKGPAGAPVTIQIFSDFQCPFCRRANPTLKELEKAFPRHVRFVWRDLPLPFHQHARDAARAAREAFAQKGKKGFWAMHDLLFQNQRALTRSDLEGYAAQLKLDLKRFELALEDGRHDAAIAADEAVAKKFKITGTPGFVVNSYFISGAQPLGVFKRRVKRALADRRAGKRP